MEGNRSYEIEFYENQSVYSEYDENKKYDIHANSNMRKNKGKYD